MLQLFYTEVPHTDVTVLYVSIESMDYVRVASYGSDFLCGSIEPIDYVAFVLYRSVSVSFIRNPCPIRLHRVNRLCYFCSIQKLAVLFWFHRVNLSNILAYRNCLSCVVQSS